MEKQHIRIIVKEVLDSLAVNYLKSEISMISNIIEYHIKTDSLNDEVIKKLFWEVGFKARITSIDSVKFNNKLKEKLKDYIK